MRLRSKLFATVALPVLSAAVMVEPVAASAVTQTERSVSQSRTSEPVGILVAQDATVTCSDGSQAADQATCDAIDAQRAADQQAAEEAQRAAEQQAAEEAQRAAEQQAAEEAQRAAEQQAAEEAQRAAEQQAAEEAQRAAEQQAAEEAQRAAEQQAAEEAQRAAEQQAAEEAQRAAEQQAAEEAQRAAEQQAAEEAQRAAEQQAAEEAQRAAEQQAAQEAQQAAEQQAAEEAQKAAEEAQQPAPEMVTCADGSQAASADACPAPEAPAEQPAEEQVPAEQPAEEQAPAEQPAEEPAPADQTEQAPAQEQQQDQAAPAEEPVTAPTDEQTQQGEAAPAEQPAQDATTQDATTPDATPDQATTEQPADQQPVEEVVVPAVEPPAEVPVEEIVDTRTEEQKQEIAEDPAATAETVVLPVDNGGAVLDSDKDADNTGSAETREVRTQLRAETEVAPAPESDAAAQADAAKVEPQVIQAFAAEQGTQLDAAPTFEVPTTVVNNVTNATNVTNITNVTNVTNNVTNINQVNQVRVIEQVDNRTVINIGNQVVVRGDDRPRLRWDASETYYEELPRGRVRETIERADGSRLVTIYNRYGDIILRSRFTSDGDEYVLLYSPEADSERARIYVDVGYSLPPMRLTVPVDDYIVTTSRAPDRDYYDFLAQPPVERVERVYSMDEVKSSSRLRDKVRRIDLDTITFPSGSAEVPLAQAKTLRKVAEAMQKVLDKDPGETFLIEGHTDAVGSDRSNLILSDQRAETVANLLTEVYGIPPENLSVQGYGERYLKIRTAEAEQQNRRVAIRRVTSLVRPATTANR
ncbi:OmpA family protein [Rhizobium sp. CAU 1783]